MIRAQMCRPVVSIINCGNVRQLKVKYHVGQVAGSYLRVIEKIQRTACSSVVIIKWSGDGTVPL